MKHPKPLLETTLQLLVPNVVARSMTVHSPVAKGGGGNNAVYSNEPAGVRLTLPNPAVYLVVELSHE